MKRIVKCWKTKQDKTVKGLFYETDKGRFLLTFDKWAIIALFGSYKAYKELKEGDEVCAEVFVDEPLPIIENGGAVN